MKTLILITAAAAFFSVNVKAQDQLEEPVYSNGKEVFMKKDTCLRLQSFSAQSENGKICIRWSVSNLKSVGTFLVYRSNDGLNYEIIGIRQSEKETGAVSAVYYYVDCSPVSPQCCYKIVHLGINNAYFVSSELPVLNSQ